MSLDERARAWRRESLRVLLLETAATASSGTLAFFGASALADRFIALPQGVRWGALAAWSAWLAWIAATRLAGPWRASSWDAVFAEAARAWPESRPLLASAWALRAG
jgi:hypothetical protein